MIKLAPYWDGFGDLWAITSYSCLLSQRVEHPVHLSKWSVKSMWDRETEIRDILGNLDDGYAENVMVTAERFSTNSRFSVAYHHEPYVPTKVKWARNDGRIISYQVETSTTHRPDRFCDPWFIDDLRDRLPDYDFVALGKHHQSTIGEVIDILSKSELFVGIATPMRPPSPPPPLLSPPPLPPEHAASASMEPAARVARSTFFVFFTVCPFTVCHSWTTLSW